MTQKKDIFYLKCLQTESKKIFFHFLLRNILNRQTVFIHASIEKRADRIVSVYGERTESPENRITTKDKQRRAYYLLYTGIEWGLSQNYILCLDSGTLGIPYCVQAIVQAYRK